MKKDVFVVAGVVLVVGAVAWWRYAPSSAAPAGPATAPATSPAGVPIPRLVEFGAGKCESCKKMAPIVEELRAEYAGRVDVLSIDVIKQEELAKSYDWKLIPAQMIFDANGKRVFYHEGFLPKDEIIAELRKLGVK